MWIKAPNWPATTITVTVNYDDRDGDGVGVAASAVWTLTLADPPAIPKLPVALTDGTITLPEDKWLALIPSHGAPAAWKFIVGPLSTKIAAGTRYTKPSGWVSPDPLDEEDVDLDLELGMVSYMLSETIHRPYGEFSVIKDGIMDVFGFFGFPSMWGARGDAPPDQREMTVTKLRDLEWDTSGDEPRLIKSELYEITTPAPTAPIFNSVLIIGDIVIFPEMYIWEGGWGVEGLTYFSEMWYSALQDYAVSIDAFEPGDPMPFVVHNRSHRSSIIEWRGLEPLPVPEGFDDGTDFWIEQVRKGSARAILTLSPGTTAAGNVDIAAPHAMSGSLITVSDDDFSVAIQL